MVIPVNIAKKKHLLRGRVCKHKAYNYIQDYIYKLNLLHVFKIFLCYSTGSFISIRQLLLHVWTSYLISMLNTRYIYRASANAHFVISIWLYNVYEYFAMYTYYMMLQSQKLFTAYMQSDIFVGYSVLVVPFDMTITSTRWYGKYQYDHTHLLACMQFVSTI